MRCRPVVCCNHRRVCGLGQNRPRAALPRPRRVRLWCNHCPWSPGGPDIASVMEEDALQPVSGGDVRKAPKRGLGLGARLPGQQRPERTHRTTSQRPGRNRRVDGRTRLHRAAKRRQRPHRQPAGHERLYRRRPGGEVVAEVVETMKASTPAATRLPTSSASSTASPSRPTSWRSTPPWKPPERVNKAEGFAVVAGEVRSLAQRSARSHQKSRASSPPA